MRALFPFFLATLFVFSPAFNEAQGADGFFESNGTRIHYTLDGQGEPVLLIHGFAINSATQWVLPGIVKSLAKDYRVIAIDNRGHGQSEKPHDPKGYGLELVEDAVRLLDHLKIEKAHVVGYSMGGLIALKLVTTHPDRVLSVALGGMGLMRPSREPMLAELAKALEDGRGFAPLIYWLSGDGRRKPDDSQVAFVNKYLQSANDVKAMAALIRSSLDEKLEIADEDLKTVQVPLLAVIGDRDPFKASVDLLKKHAPALRVVVVPGGDHFGVVFHPLFLRALKEHLAGNQAKAVK